MATPGVVAYAADTMDSLKTLERTCERDESRLTSQLVSLQLAAIDTVDGTKATAATYERIDTIRVGHLIVEQYDGTPVDEQSRIAIHTGKQEPHVCTGKAFISNQATDVMVFREKAQ